MLKKNELKEIEEKIKELESQKKALLDEAKNAEIMIDRPEDKKGKVIDVIERGYMLGDKVLRFAKVVVGE